jgi:uncharacterized membrane protein YczE
MTMEATVAELDISEQSTSCHHGRMPSAPLLPMSPRQQLRAGRLPRRLVQLLTGLTLFGGSLAMMIRAQLGLAPWDVFHYGVAVHLPLSFGTVTIIVGACVLLSWIPLRQMPGVGTVANIFVIGIVTDAALSVLTTPGALWQRAVLLAAGIVLNGLAGAMYIGSQLGPGPRDGLMTGLVQRTGRSVGLVRTAIELTVLAAGWLMGGVAGVGTVAYALGIGPIVHVLLPRLTVRLEPGSTEEPRVGAALPESSTSG